MMKHGFASEETTDPNPIYATDEFAIFIARLDRMGPPKLVKFGVRSEDLAIDPAVRPVGVGACFHHFYERFIDGEVELFH